MLPYTWNFWCFVPPSPGLERLHEKHLPKVEVGKNLYTNRLGEWEN